MKMSLPWVLSLALVSVLTSGAAEAAVVNVSSQWCGNSCSEGHDDVECVCTFRSWMSQSDPAAWVSCEEVACCESASAYCDLGYVNQSQCYPGEAGHGGEAYEPLYCNVWTEHGEKTCEVPCGASGCYIYYNAPHYELVNEQEPNLCTRSKHSPSS